MLSEEEKNAISQCRLLLEGEITLHVIGDDGGTDYCGKVNKAYNEDLKTVLNLVENHQKKINKAIEYIENAKKELYGCGNYYLSDLLNILKGELNERGRKESNRIYKRV